MNPIDDVMTFPDEETGSAPVEETTSQATEETTRETTQPSEPVETTTEATTEEIQVQFAMDREEVYLVYAGETFTLYAGEIDPALIVWSSEDEAVATVSEGVVTAVASGETYVYGEYEGVRSGCKIFCNLQEPTESQYVPADSRDPVKAPPTTQVVDASFFDDAAFVGDSVSLMLSNYCDNTHALGNATFLVRGSYGVANEVVNNYHIVYKGAETVLEDALVDCGVNKVFIMLGMNDIGLYGIEDTIARWDTLISRIRGKLPNIEIYIQSMTPIWTGGEIGDLNNENVRKYNIELQAFAEANGCKYIDVASYMVDSTGGLPTSYCSDNYVHVTEAGCKAWIQVLMAYTGY